MADINNEVNKELERVLGGNYCASRYYTGDAELTEETDYHFCIVTDGNIFRLQTNKGFLECPKEDVNFELFWNLLGDVPVNEDNETEEQYIHFGVGTDTHDIWHWFEWFFDMSIGETYFS